jgi:hypothetical protein
MKILLLNQQLERVIRRKSKNISAFLDYQFRVATSGIRTLPSFLILGTAKGGTTSLHRYLEEHPCVSSTLKKEVHFFDRFFDKGLPWYKTYFPLQYRNLIAGDSTPYYLLYPHAPKRALACVPNAKLIVLLRNPIDRAYSFHNMNFKRPDVDEPLSFEEAIKAEPERLAGEMEKMIADETYVSYNYEHYSYLTGGTYIEQLKNWCKFFSKEQMLILKSEDLFRDPASIYQQVLEVLGLPIWNLKAYKNANPREYSSPLSSETRSCLTEYFQPYNEALYKYLGVDCHWND